MVYKQDRTNGLLVGQDEWFTGRTGDWFTGRTGDWFTSRTGNGLQALQDERTGNGLQALQDEWSTPNQTACKLAELTKQVSF